MEKITTWIYKLKIKSNADWQKVNDWVANNKKTYTLIVEVNGINMHYKGAL